MNSDRVFCLVIQVVGILPIRAEPQIQLVIIAKYDCVLGVVDHEPCGRPQLVNLRLLSGGQRMPHAL